MAEKGKSPENDSFMSEGKWFNVLTAKAFWIFSLNGPLLCEGFRARQGLAQHLSE